MAKPNYAFEKRQKEIAKKKKKEEKRQRKSADNDQVAHDVSATTGEASTPSAPAATE